jgi:hypothetical protein
LQAAIDRGEVALPRVRPAWLGERAWRVVVRHLVDRFPSAALGREAGISGVAVRALALRSVERLRHPELAHLPTALRRVLVAGGCITRVAVNAARDDELLALPGVTPGALWRLRRGATRRAPTGTRAGPPTEHTGVSTGGAPGHSHRAAATCRRAARWWPTTTWRGSSATCAGAPTPAWRCTRAGRTG